MSFNWELLRPSQELSEAHQALVREIGEAFLKTGTGVPDHQKRVQLGRARNRLIELNQLGLIRNQWNQYFPTFPALYYLSPTLRDNCVAILHLLFAAIKSLYEAQPKAFAIQEIEARANSLLSSGTWTEWAHTLKGGDVHLQRAMYFFHDFTRLVSIQNSSPGNLVGALTATDYILDYESLQQAWKEELDLRPRAQPNQAEARSTPQDKGVEAKTTLPNEASEDRAYDSAELLRLAREAKSSNELARADKLLRSAVARAAELKDDGALIDAEAALATILAKGGLHEEAEEYYKRSVELARTTKNDVAEARALVGLGQLLEDRGKTRRPEQAYLRVREIAEKASPDSVLWQYAQEANSRIGHLRQTSPDIDDTDADKERLLGRPGEEIPPQDQSSIEHQLEEPPGESIEMLQLRKSIVGDAWWKRIKNKRSGAETIGPTDSQASKPRRLWQAIVRKKRFAVQFNPWRHDKEDSLWAAFALEFLRQTKGQRFLLRRWWGSAKLFKAHYKWKKGWFEPLRALAVWLTIVTLLVGFIKVLIQDPWWAAQLAIALLNKPDDSGGKVDLLNILLTFGGNAAFAAIILTIWLKAKDSVGNPFEINLKKYLRSPDYEGRVAFVEQFHADFRKIVDAYAGQEKVFVFIDDLDRCEVPKAAELMKAINLLIADDPRLIFVLGMDRDKVAAGIAVKYDKILTYLSPQGIAVSNEPQARWRAGLNFGQNFLQKFIQLPFRVPEPNPEQYDDFIRTISVPSKTETVNTTSLTNQNPATNKLPPTTKAPTETKDTDAKVHTVPPAAPSPAEVQVRRERELQFGGDSDKVRAVASMFANTLGRNPRRMIQFLNLFRLQAYIANELGLFDSYVAGKLRPSLTLEQLGKFVAISLRWPALVAQFAEDPKLLGKLERFATDNPLADSTPTENERRWLSELPLLSLLNFGIEQRSEAFLLSDYSVSSPTIYNLLHICPQRVRLPQTPPPAEPSAA